MIKFPDYLVRNIQNPPGMTSRVSWENKIFRTDLAVLKFLNGSLNIDILHNFDVLPNIGKHSAWNYFKNHDSR